MIEGRFFSIPESPSDVDRLRYEASPLSRSTRPPWLEQADSDYYRYLGNRSAAGLASDDRNSFLEEIQHLETAGLVTDRDQANPDVHHIYIRSTSDYDIWSIGIYAGQSLWDLRPAAGATNPVLTREDVTDAPAVLVADPFMVQRGSEWFMFFELLNWRANKGEIGLATSRDGLHWRYQQRVLVEPFHLSYPCVFEDGGDYYMVPESRQSKQVRLYRAVDFPVNWSLVCVLMEDTELVDSTVFQKDGRWWMLSGSSGQFGCSDLRLLEAKSLVGPWKEHPASPVVKDNRQNARPAGRVVQCGRQLVRFAQNCDRVYGRDVRAFEICELTSHAYREHERRDFEVLRPGDSGWNKGGMHHVDAHICENAKWLACVDGWRMADDFYCHRTIGSDSDGTSVD